jgi:predicted nucleic acid-binding protein
MEVGDALGQPQNRPRFARLLELLREQADVEIVTANTLWFWRGCEFHARHADKERSLTDCIFFVLRERKITEAVTTDCRFEQAGFRRKESAAKHAPT